MRPKHAALASVLACLTLVSACSYSTDFAIINESDSPIEVIYKLKLPSNALWGAVKPAVSASSELSRDLHRDWRELSSAEYKYDEKSRTVVVTVAPHQALLVADMFHYFGPHDPNDVKSFPLEAIEIKGINGTLRLEGLLAQTSFFRESQVLYTLTYGMKFQTSPLDLP